MWFYGSIQVIGFTKCVKGMAKNVPRVTPNCDKVPFKTPAYFLYFMGAIS